jgi:Amt family ammonium transporter
MADDPADPAAAGDFLNNGDNAWQMTAATFVGMQTMVGLVMLYGGVVKKKWAVNSAFMVM